MSTKEVKRVNRPTLRGLKTVRFVIIASAAAWCSNCPAQLRIVSYNTALKSGAGIDVVLQAIGEESINGIAKPIDILALQEQVSMGSTTQQIVDTLNDLYGQDIYARSSVNGASFGAGRPGLIYNTRSVELLDERAIGRLGSEGNARQTLRYWLRPVGYDSTADFVLYNSHFKGLQDDKNPARRNAEARTIRADADSLGEDVPIIYAGDLNLYTSSEPAYQTLLARGNGRAFDPIRRRGQWHNRFGFRDVHTQSSTTAGGENRAGGGMDDRFDFQLVSGELLDGQGLSYIGLGIPDLHIQPIQHSYRAFGNNGTHQFNQDISTGSGATPNVLAALKTASDHLPVVADYQLPAKMGVTVESVPPRVIVDTDVQLGFAVENTAPAVAPIGADQLRYSVRGSGSLHGALIDVDDPMGGGNVHAVALDTATVGLQVGNLFVGTTSVQVPDSILNFDIAYDVVQHANASFNAAHNQDTLTIDLGSFPLDSGRGVQSIGYDIFNLSTRPDFTASLALYLSAAEGDVSVLSASIDSSTLAAGRGVELVAVLRTDEVGEFESTWTIATADEDLPGGAVGDDLILRLTGSVTQPSLLEAGDANEDLVFDQSDIVQVLQAAKYLTGATASWSEGDWNGAPGGRPGSPPTGDGLFDQRDVVAALQNGLYLQGRYAAGMSAWPSVVMREPAPHGLADYMHDGGDSHFTGISAAVPEPPSGFLMGFAMLLLFVGCHWRLASALFCER